MRKIALATSNQYSELTRDDRLVLDQLLFWGVDVEPIVWDSKDAAWSQYDAVIIRSCWDYHLRHEAFFAWIDALEKEGVVIFNSSKILRKNYHKKYLKELSEERDIPVAPTVWLSRQEPFELHQILSEQSWQQAVIKPVISANAEQTWLTSLSTARQDQSRIEELLQTHSELMVQKFIDEIKSNGEWSFIFFDDNFSHSVLKLPKEGDFRVQENLGGTCISKRPPGYLAEQAQKVVDAVDDKCLYARVDGIEVDKQLLLMELELIEPALYLEKHPKAPTRFADAIVAAVNALPTEEHQH